MSVNVIVGIRVNDDQQIIRCIIGYFGMFPLAEKVVLENMEDMHANLNEYIVIEEMTAGVYPTATAAHFYRWTDGQYVPVIRPKGIFDGMRNFSTGQGVIKDPVKETQEELECLHYPECQEPEWISSAHCHRCRVYRG